MGWKSTIDISRHEAMGLIIQFIHEADNEQLSNVLNAIGFGENDLLPYFGHNFNIYDNNSRIEENNITNDKQ